MKFAKVMFPQCLFVHGGSLPEGSLSWGGVSLSEGSLCPWGLCPGRVSVRDSPPPYGKVRAVRILLECILVISPTSPLFSKAVPSALLMSLEWEL